MAVGMPLQISPRVFVLDGGSGSMISNPSIPQSTITDQFGDVSSCDCYSPVSQPIVDPDGTIELSSSDSANLYPGNLIPDGDGGVLATWTIVLCATAKDSLRENGNRVSPESGVGLRHDVRT